MAKNYEKTIRACFIGYIVQAIVNNFAPLLFITFQTTYDIPLAQITTLITINFALQLMTDLAAAYFTDKIGYRASVLIAHTMAALGLIGLAVFPSVMPSPFVGLVMAVVLYAIGGGRSSARAAKPAPNICSPTTVRRAASGYPPRPATKSSCPTATGLSRDRSRRLTMTSCRAAA